MSLQCPTTFALGVRGETTQGDLPLENKHEMCDGEVECTHFNRKSKRVLGDGKEGEHF